MSAVRRGRLAVIVGAALLILGLVAFDISLDSNEERSRGITAATAVEYAVILA